ncbi:YdcF family protein [Siminovitchia fortis]|uniref:YdcF family protein n=1 Tax=Siminovitchia fortis TaxID=254758 RepID=UPI0011AA1EEE|nr:YdcF family protein [Siminovitchia fortis]
MRLKKIAACVLAVFFGACLFIWILTGRWMADGKKPKADGTYEYALVLGAKVNGETPSLSLQYRLEAALQYAEQHPHVKLVLSGGQGPDEFVSEAEAMKRYLVAHGIPENRFILEKNSSSTYENILYSTKLLPPSTKGITIITSGYHLARARKIAGRLGLDTDAVEAETPMVVRLKLTTRERLALLKTAFSQK